MKSDQKTKAIELRKNGFSYSEILKEIPAPNLRYRCGLRK